MNTTEKNILIAEFMGMIYDNHNDQPNKYWELTDEQNFVSQKPYPQHKDLKFHSDWNWLMQVVEKIESLGEGIYQVDILQEGCRINERCKTKFDLTVSKLSAGTTKIQAVYAAYVELIQWLNENKK